MHAWIYFCDLHDWQWSTRQGKIDTRALTTTRFIYENHIWKTAHRAKANVEILQVNRVFTYFGNSVRIILIWCASACGKISRNGTFDCKFKRNWINCWTKLIILGVYPYKYKQRDAHMRWVANKFRICSHYHKMPEATKKGAWILSNNWWRL